MKKEELLKIFSAYLPYKVLVSDEDDNGFNESFELAGVTSNDDGALVYDNLDGSIQEYRIDLLKLNLWDLSYLTKEIEHEGKIFVPMHVLKNGGTGLNEYRFLEWKGYSAIDNEQHETCYDPNTMSFYQFYMGDSRMCTKQYEKFQMLLKWHFNVFNLPEGEFINKSTLNK